MIEIPRDKLITVQNLKDAIERGPEDLDVSEVMIMMSISAAAKATYLASEMFKLTGMEEEKADEVSLKIMQNLCQEDYDVLFGAMLTQAIENTVREWNTRIAGVNNHRRQRGG